MKTSILFIIIVLICACDRKERLNEFSQLVEKQGLYYQADSRRLFTGTVIDKYENNQVHRKISLKDGRIEGPYESYYESGFLEIKGSYKNAEWDRSYVRYYENGQLQRREFYKKGELDGPYESYYESGQLEVKGLYKEGRWDGSWERYYENGQLESKGYYNKGRRDRVWEHFYENGDLERNGSYKDGEWKSTAGFSDWNLDGPAKHYSDHGHLMTK